jgi:hypothetical protein
MKTAAAILDEVRTGWDEAFRLAGLEPLVGASVLQSNARSPENRAVQPMHRARKDASGHYHLKIVAYLPCERCGARFPCTRPTNQRYCSKRCKKSVWQREHAAWWNDYQRRHRAERNAA